jgi:hypothetical protein
MKASFGHLDSIFPRRDPARFQKKQGGISL